MGINGKACFSLADRFATNGVGERSPDKYTLLAGFICEVVMTFAFLMIIMGSTHGKAPAGFAPIGLGLTLIHLISIPVTNTSVNPARATSQALFVQG